MSDSRLKFTVSGVDSAKDVDDITDELQTLEGVQLVEVDADTGQTEVRYGEELLSEEKIKSTVRDAGYEVE